MLSIAVCDDYEGCRNELSGHIGRLLEELDIHYTIRQYMSAEAFLHDGTAGFDIVFMDIEMCGISGMEAARRIREHDGLITIVFVTNYVQYATEGYAVNAYRYILKPIQYYQFNREMRDVFKKLSEARKKSIYIRTDREHIVLCQGDIIYIENTAAKSVIFHTKDREITQRSPLSKWEADLRGAGFFRCHTSYLVNLEYIAEIGKESVRMQQGAVIPLSKHRRKDFVQAFTHYMGGLL